MNSNRIVFSVIIPHRDSLSTLPRLFGSIPDREDVEILLVDNSSKRISWEDVKISRNFTLLYSDPSRGAGGARNVGVENAHGQWLLFADADDYYSPVAFDVFFLNKDTDVDIVYTGMGGIYEDTGSPSPRGDRYVKIIKWYLDGKISEDYLRTHFHSPCCKMVRSSLVKEHNIKFSEVVAGNDAFFSMVTGFYARSITAIDVVTYIATVSHGSLTQRKDKVAYMSRYKEDLKINSFLRSHGKKRQQYRVLGTIWRAREYSLSTMLQCLLLAIKSGQNLFVGLNNK